MPEFIISAVFQLSIILTCISGFFCVGAVFAAAYESITGE